MFCEKSAPRILHTYSIPIIHPFYKNTTFARWCPDTNFGASSCHVKRVFFIESVILQILTTRRFALQIRAKKMIYDILGDVNNFYQYIVIENKLLATCFIHLWFSISICVVVRSITATCLTFTQPRMTICRWVTISDMMGGAEQPLAVVAHFTNRD